MLNRSPCLILLILCFCLLQSLNAQDYRRNNKRFLPKKEVPLYWEIVVGGQGDLAHTLGKHDNYYPYGTFRIGARVYTYKNKVYGTPGIGAGSFSWDNFEVEVIGGTLKKGDGLFSSDKVKISNPRQVPHHLVKVKITYKDLPDKPKIVSIPLDFAQSYKFVRNGVSGRKGWEAGGRAGSGAPGRNYTQYDGENGTHGFHGKHGRHGRSGNRGPDLNVTLSPYQDKHTQELIIQVRIKDVNSGWVRKRWFNPATNKMTLISRGGSGGRGGYGQAGGHGGNGGRGGRAGVEGQDDLMANGGNGGDGGWGGNGGNGGNGGPGGHIRVYYPPMLKPYLNKVKVFSKGGAAGRAGKGGRGGKAGRGGRGTEGNGSRGRTGQTGEPGYPGQKGPDGTVEWIPTDPG